MRKTVAKRLKKMAHSIVVAKAKDGKVPRSKLNEKHTGELYYPNSTLQGMYRSLKKRYRELGHDAFTRIVQEAQSE